MSIKLLSNDDILLVALGKSIWFSLYVNHTVAFIYKIVDNDIFYRSRSSSNYDLTGFTKDEVIQMLNGETIIYKNTTYSIHMIFNSEEEVRDYITVNR